MPLNAQVEDNTNEPRSTQCFLALMLVQKAADLVTFCAFCWLLCLLTGDLHAALRYAGAECCNVAGRSRSRAGSNMAKSDMWVNMVKCLKCLARKHLFFLLQTGIYVPKNAIAAIKIGVLFLRKNQAFNPVHPHMSPRGQARSLHIPSLLQKSNLSNLSE